MALIISGATIIDGVSERPIEHGSIWVEEGRIRAVVGPHEFFSAPTGKVLDARGKYVIPGMMNANVHLLAGIFLPANLLRYMDAIEDIALEAAQVALRNGLTTVFDTIGPRKPLIAVRDRISTGQVIGSRVFCAGWLIGADGILSLDFNAKAAEVLGRSVVERVNGLCVENVGPALSWMAPEQVAREVREYIGRGIDFIKYASNEHRWGDPTTSLVFSPRAQKAMVEEAHRAGLTAQAHTTAIESLRIAVEAGCDVIQHCNITGPFAIPESTLEMFAAKKTGAVVFPFTRKRLKWVFENCPTDRAYHATSDENCGRLIECGARLMLGNDGAIWGPDIVTDAWLSKSWLVPGEDDLNALDHGHFVWLKAMEEKGMAPMEILRAATRNVAEAYGKGRDLGTVEVGKIADLLILDKDPLQSTENYRSIHAVIKDGVLVDREALPNKPILTRPTESPSVEMLAYRAHRHIGRSAFPTCPMCCSH